ncbi:WD repeat domain phosphoinositide-interacting protein 1 isoform X3 [Phyllopteryx taeniolatus]|uniref:WD repeat domain phosphoinositide-interacting protein 1 isoform X3 n=1 Tax=Phyllopteryx taeniolatus TaxID=161469 RepID=UPI002AD30003|nr:WD repeat domain phosphoinositide-interacting protein 1 isoform X3 [Phyllopteryx taeniolatus]
MESAVGASGPGGPDGPDTPGVPFGCASFNQDSTSLALGTKTGYKLFSLTTVDKLDCIHESETSNVYIVERLFSSSLVVVVSTTTPQLMNIYHFKKGTEICNYSYPNNILAVKLNRHRLAVCLVDSIYIHNIKDMKLLKTLLNIPSNPSGLCALSTNHSNSYLAYPGNATMGEIIVYDANNMSTVTMVPAHDSPLAALCFNASATKLASASERGTVIRVFSIPEGLRLFEFRRGMKRYVNISSLSFSPDAQFLCASSNTETVHIFKLEQVGPSGDETASWSAYVGKMFTAASSYLPAPVSGMMSQDRAFATVHLVTSGQRNVCALTMIQKLPRLLVATADGQLFIYNVNPEDGGFLVLMTCMRLIIKKQRDQKSQCQHRRVHHMLQLLPYQLLVPPQRLLLLHPHHSSTSILTPSPLDVSKPSKSLIPLIMAGLTTLQSTLPFIVAETLQSHKTSDIFLHAF